MICNSVQNGLNNIIYSNNLLDLIQKNKSGRFHLDYKPDPNSNIGKIYHAIPSNRIITRTRLKELMEKNGVPLDSITIHAGFLIKKGLIFKGSKDNEPIYSRTKTLINGQAKPEKSEKADKANYGSLSVKVLDYCKENIGKRILSKEVVNLFGRHEKDSNPLGLLQRLRSAGAIQYIENTSPYEYLVLPEIKTLERIPTKKQMKNNGQLPSVVQPQTKIDPVNPQNNIANMTMSEILEDYVRLKIENQRLKEGLQRMGMEFIHLNILEEH